jgi:hypothetical protein
MLDLIAAAQLIEASSCRAGSLPGLNRTESGAILIGLAITCAYPGISAEARSASFLAGCERGATNH